MLPPSLARYAPHPLVLIFAPSVKSPAYEQQMMQLDGDEAGLEVRDLHLGHLFFEGESRIGTEALSHEDAYRLREHFGVEDEDFRFVLLGPDGTTSYESDTPVNARALYRKIDTDARSGPAQPAHGRTSQL